MIVIGLTGSIGMGKTTAAAMLRAENIPVFCADDAVHDLMRADGEGVAAIAAIFPAAYDKKARTIDRKKLRAALGYDHENWDRVEAVIHPLVRRAQKEFIHAETVKGRRMVVLDIPLLFETGAEENFDYIICVSAPAFLQRQRVMARPGMTAADFAFRLARQIPDAVKRQRADFVVPTGLGQAVTRRALRAIIKSIQKQNG